MTAVEPILILQHGETAPPALLADWADERGIPYEVHRVDLEPDALPSLDGRPFIVSLGSDNSADAHHLPEVANELELLRDAIAREIPVLGLCYGAQALAVAMGGAVERAPEPELGWQAIDTDVPGLIHNGPWLTWHYDRFTIPPGAVQLASSERAPQAFRRGPHLGVQFHPEATVEIVKTWARMDHRNLERLGIADGEALADASERQIDQARLLAFALFDGFHKRLSEHTRTVARTNGRTAGWPLGRNVTSVRLLYPDLHGIPRGKDVPAAEFEHVVEKGLCFCAAVMGTDLRHTPVVGGEQGYPDLIARPDLSTMLTLPWDPGVACCLADLEPAHGGDPICDPRGALRRAIAVVGQFGYEPIVGPELEFFLVVRDPALHGGVRRHVDRLSMVYTVGPQADPGGLVRRMTEQLAALGLEVFAVNHEFMNSQYEINLRHADALTAADRAFRLKSAVKDIAAQHGLIATFMGKPFNDQGGSGTHLHLSLRDGERNAFDAPAQSNGVSAELRGFTAGLIAHAAGLMAFLNPTINAYRRIAPDSLAPTHANWGFDNRATFVRIPPERGGATRIEIRVGDGSANPYLAIAAVLHAGAAGIRDELAPPEPLSGDAYRAGPSEIGQELPRTLEAALDALEQDATLSEGIGEVIVSTFLAMKRFEIERHRAWVSDWEVAEYLEHL